MPRDLSALARAYGVRTAYKNASGRRVTASPEALLAVLRAIGAPVDSAAGAGEALRSRRLEMQRRCVEPVVVAWDGCFTAQLRVAEKVSRAVKAELVLEDGSTCRVPAPGRARGPVEELEGVRWSCFELNLAGTLPTGYHKLVVHAGGRHHEAHVFSAPSRAARRFERCWGLFVPAYSLHSAGSWGAGDLGDLRALAEWMGRQGGSVLATLPMFAAFPEEASPYRPVSRLFWEERYLDAKAFPAFRGCSEAVNMASSPGFRKELAALQQSDLIDYPGVGAAKRSAMQVAAKHFFSDPGRRLKDFEKFVAKKPEAEEYARFRAARELQVASGKSGPLPERLEAGHFKQDARQYHLFAQWAIHDQLGNLGGEMESSGRQLLLDLPLGVHPDGYDVWSYRESHIKGMSIGAPGDMFFPGGQKWGMAPPNPEKLRQDGHHLWRRCLQTVLEPAGAVRIDHIMGFHRLFLIPEDASAAEGAYLEYPAEELYAAALIEARRCNAALIGEDLGTVEPAVRSRMRRHGIYGTYVMQFQFRPDSPTAFEPPGDHQCASLNTHDTATFAGFWTGSDLDEREKMGMLDAASARRQRRLLGEVKKAVRGVLEGSKIPVGSTPASVAGACLRVLGESRAGLVLATLEDLWGETRRQNLPGTGPEKPNWRRKTRYGVEELIQRPEVGRMLTGLQQARKDPGHGKRQASRRR